MEYASLYHLTGPKIPLQQLATTRSYNKGINGDATFDVSFSINLDAEGIEKAEPAAKTYGTP